VEAGHRTSTSARLALSRIWAPPQCRNPLRQRVQRHLLPPYLRHPHLELPLLRLRLDEFRLPLRQVVLLRRNLNSPRSDDQGVNRRHLPGLTDSKSAERG
jgi:hypothetical protein